MKYYKDTNNNVYAYELDGSQDHLIGDKVAMTADEIEAHLNPPITPEQLTQSRINELKSLLANTDFKVLPDYQQRSGKTDAEMAQILADRKAWYDELKELIK
jgi:hypothetical protein